jgi:hypothetical protein
MIPCSCLSYRPRPAPPAWTHWSSCTWSGRPRRGPGSRAWQCPDRTTAGENNVKFHEPLLAAATTIFGPPSQEPDWESLISAGGGAHPQGYGHKGLMAANFLALAPLRHGLDRLCRRQHERGHRCSRRDVDLAAGMCGFSVKEPASAPHHHIV